MWLDAGLHQEFLQQKNLEWRHWVLGFIRSLVLHKLFLQWRYTLFLIHQTLDKTICKSSKTKVYFRYI